MEESDGILVGANTGVSVAMIGDDDGSIDGASVLLSLEPWSVGRVVGVPIDLVGLAVSKVSTKDGTEDGSNVGDEVGDSVGCVDALSDRKTVGSSVRWECEG